MPKQTQTQSAEEIRNNQADYKIAEAYLMNIYGKGSLTEAVKLTPTNRSVQNILTANIARLPD